MRAFWKIETDNTPYREELWKVIHGSPSPLDNEHQGT